MPYIFLWFSILFWSHSPSSPATLTAWKSLGFPSWPWGLRSCHSFISPRVSMSNRLQWLQYDLQRQITTDCVKKHFPCKQIIKACSLHRFESVRRSEFMFFIFFRSGYSCIYALSTASVLHIVRCEMPLQSGCHSKHWRDFVINASVNSNLSVAACVPDGWWPDGSPFRTSQGFQQDMWYTADCFVAC